MSTQLPISEAKLTELKARLSQAYNAFNSPDKALILSELFYLHLQRQTSPPIIDTSVAAQTALPFPEHLISTLDDVRRFYVIAQQIRSARAKELEEDFDRLGALRSRIMGAGAYMGKLREAWPEELKAL